jgi:hypothetical protein
VLAGWLHPFSSCRITSGEEMPMSDGRATSYEIVELDDQVAVLIHYSTGGVGFRRGFQTSAEARSWIKQEEAKNPPAC